MLQEPLDEYTCDLCGKQTKSDRGEKPLHWEIVQLAYKKYSQSWNFFGEKYHVCDSCVSDPDGEVIVTKRRNVFQQLWDRFRLRNSDPS